jgi:hypothetical protein
MVRPLSRSITKDDLPEIRGSLQTATTAERPFYAVVRDKLELVSYVKQQNTRDKKLSISAG